VAGTSVYTPCCRHRGVLLICEPPFSAYAQQVVFSRYRGQFLPYDVCHLRQTATLDSLVSLSLVFIVADVL
jgi:hypothetical protein